VATRLATLLVGEVDDEIDVEPTAARALGEILDRRLSAQIIEGSGAQIGDQ
jgi:hypothetical protein